jgi:hypothetical protein
LDAARALFSVAATGMAMHLPSSKGDDDTPNITYIDAVLYKLFWPNEPNLAHSKNKSARLASTRQLFGLKTDAAE